MNASLISLLTHEFFSTSHQSGLFSKVKSNITHDPLLFACVSVAAHVCSNTLSSTVKVQVKSQVVSEIASVTGTNSLLRDALKTLSPSASAFQPNALRPQGCFFFFLLKSWGVKTGMSWLDGLFNLSLSAQEAPLCWHSSSFFFFISPRWLWLPAPLSASNKETGDLEPEALKPSLLCF